MTSNLELERNARKLITWERDDAVADRMVETAVREFKKQKVDIHVLDLLARNLNANANACKVSPANVTEAVRIVTEQHQMMIRLGEDATSLNHLAPSLEHALCTYATDALTNPSFNHVTLFMDTLTADLEDLQKCVRGQWLCMQAWIEGLMHLEDAFAEALQTKIDAANATESPYELEFVAPIEWTIEMYKETRLTRIRSIADHYSAARRWAHFDHLDHHVLFWKMKDQGKPFPSWSGATVPQVNAHYAMMLTKMTVEKTYEISSATHEAFARGYQAAHADIEDRLKLG